MDQVSPSKISKSQVKKKKRQNKTKNRCYFLHSRILSIVKIVLQNTTGQEPCNYHFAKIVSQQHHQHTVNTVRVENFLWSHQSVNCVG